MFISLNIGEFVNENKEWLPPHKDVEEKIGSLSWKEKYFSRGHDLLNGIAIIDIYKKSHSLGENWHVDHTIPLSKGGLHHPDNLQIVAKKYNLEKGSKLNFRMPLNTEV